MDYVKTIRGPFNVNVRFMIFDNNMKDTSVKLGTYGVIKSAPAFIVAAVEKGDMYLEQLGYEFEKAVLYATSLGLGTCWLGGTFNKSGFRNAAQLKDNEELPIVSPVGYPADNKSLLERVMRIGAGSSNRKHWDKIFFNGSLNKALNMNEAGKFAEPLEMLRLAPSASNKQPWRIVKKDGYFHFYLQHAVGYSKTLGYDIQRVDMGIAMYHFEVSAKEQGLGGKWVSKVQDIKSIPEDTGYIISWEIK
jgi:hypothetical protein